MIPRGHDKAVPTLPSCVPNYHVAHSKSVNYFWEVMKDPI